MFHVKHLGGGGKCGDFVRRMIEEGVEPDSVERELKDRILADKRVRQAVDEIVELIRKKILEEA